jgi:Ran GTPase-activating protein (RanGAP) involved in mRNA processing and transport
VISRLILKSQVLGTFSKVKLGKNQLGDEGAKLFADALRHSSTIVSLDVSSNLIGAEGGHCLLGSLLDNCSLIDINLSSNEGGLQRNTLGSFGVKPLIDVL